jgi:tRNA-specific 2-thiouridylase
MAKKWKLPVHEKKESQEICFIQDKDYREFLRRNIPQRYFKPGNIVDADGKVLGRHDGLINYTIGQRKGIEQHSAFSSQNSANKQPLYVIGFDKKKNQLIVGEDKEVYRNKMIIKDVYFVQNYESRIKNYDQLKIKIRYRHPAVEISNFKYQIPNKFKNSKSQISKRIQIIFKEPQRAITPGQSAVLYSGEEVLGGGIIS